MKTNIDKNKINDWQGNNIQSAKLMQEHEKDHLCLTGKTYLARDKEIQQTGKNENPVLHDMFGALNY